MLHGHLLLRGWFLSDVSFYTFEVPLDGLISLVVGLRSDVIHMAAAAEYALLVLFAALVAAGARSRPAARRARWAGSAREYFLGRTVVLVLATPSATC